MWTLRGVRPPIGHGYIGWTCSVATIAASAPVAHSACYYNKSAAACSRERGGGSPHPQYRRGGRPPPPPSQTEAQTEAGPTTATQQRGPAEVRTSADLATIYTTPRYQYIYVDIILPLSTHIYAICISVYCTLYSYLQSCVKRKSSYSMIL